MMTEMGAIESTWDQVQPGFDAPDAWGAITMVAAGAIFWTIHTRADSAWVSGFAVMALAGMMGMTYDVMAGEVVAATVSTTGAVKWHHQSLVQVTRLQQLHRPG